VIANMQAKRIMRMKKGKKNYSENVEDFLKAVEPFLINSWRIRSSHLDFVSKVLKFVSPYWKELYIEGWKDRVFLLPVEDKYSDIVDLVVDVIPQDQNHFRPSKKYSEFLNWLEKKGYVLC